MRPCETPELMKRKQAAYRRSQHGALRSPNALPVVAVHDGERSLHDSSPRLLIAAVILLVVRSAASPRSINDAPREVDRRVHVGNGWETARKPRIPGKVLEAKLVNELTYLCTLNGSRRLSGLGCNVICFLLERACKCQCSLSAVVLRPPAATMHDVEERDDVARVLALVDVDCGPSPIAPRTNGQCCKDRRMP